MENIFSIKLNDFLLEIHISIVFIAFILLLLWISTIFKRKWIGYNEVIELEINLGGIGKLKIKPGYEEIRIAYKAWVELSTRKAGLVFDDGNDVIVEVYDSWYILFKQMRELIKEIPIEHIRNNNDTDNLVKILVDSLNKGLRPHLTKWHTRFSKWYEIELEKEKSCTSPIRYPQEIQKNFPEYELLKNELKQINIDLLQYVSELEKIAFGK